MVVPARALRPLCDDSVRRHDWNAQGPSDDMGTRDSRTHVAQCGISEKSDLQTKIGIIVLIAHSDGGRLEIR
ncbi:hypothetical protein A0H81_01738 [Grifola frondosa]|uniref:Uncharacterized protein n=1 Tax=Grifola frondosa TaxID=5627 RepID=A0A1C7MMK5_GRIFR|nr:hypothetical protein A0H81_01738 [Grifola frondosa]